MQQGYRMSLPIIRTDEDLKAAWPATHIPCLYYTVDVYPKNQNLWDYYENEFAPSLEQKLITTNLPDMPNIGMARAAYKSFGIDPGRQRISSEALYRRVRQGKALYQINSLVDANNLASLKTGFSLGSYDISHIGPEVVFRLGGQGESYEGIGKAGMTLENMPVFADAAGPFGSPTSDSTRAMIRGNTKEAMTIIYSFSGLDALKDSLSITQHYFEQYTAVANLSITII
ncbi:MAG: phenylalanine--tRNA ligase beta subunit-related protein [Desulfovibrio sp.]|uniref:B3/B4 domain-containing protein n=1 Tax=Desulfovibrio sp. TaxID=885 RepID=UPI0039E5661B